MFNLENAKKKLAKKMAEHQFSIFAYKNKSSVLIYSKFGYSIK